jgi:hypothetical protein
MFEIDGKKIHVPLRKIKLREQANSRINRPTNPFEK